MSAGPATGMGDLGLSFLTDSHAHLPRPSGGAASPDLAGVIERARAAGIRRILNVSAALGDPPDVIETARSLDETWAAIGAHPHEAAGFTDAHAAELRQLATCAEVLAIGEIGLDYHYDHSPRPTQQDAFRRQLRLAREVGLPIVVHTREAEEDTARILEEERADEIGGVLHCFTSNQWLATRCLEMGFSISFSGIVTFPKADDLRSVARSVPLERLLIETDAPYLAPIPHRGKQNEPSFLRSTAERLALLRGETLAALAEATSANFERLFFRA